METFSCVTRMTLPAAPKAVAKQCEVREPRPGSPRRGHRSDVPRKSARNIATIPPDAISQATGVDIPAALFLVTIMVTIRMPATAINGNTTQFTTCQP